MPLHDVLQVQEQLIESQKAHNLCKHDLETCLHQCAVLAANPSCKSYSTYHCSRSTTACSRPFFLAPCTIIDRSFMLSQCSLLFQPSCCCSTNLHSDSAAEMDKELADMQHKIAAHETRVSSACKRVSAASNLIVFLVMLSLSLGRKLSGCQLFAACCRKGMGRSVCRRQNLCIMMLAAVAVYRLAALLPFLHSAASVGPSSGLSARVPAEVFRAGVQGGADVIPFGALQELQLLTAKADLEAQVQRLKAQAERKGVHLETGEVHDQERGAVGACRSAAALPMALGRQSVGTETLLTRDAPAAQRLPLLKPAGAARARCVQALITITSSCTLRMAALQQRGAWQLRYSGPSVHCRLGSASQPYTAPQMGQARLQALRTCWCRGAARAGRRRARQPRRRPAHAAGALGAEGGRHPPRLRAGRAADSRGAARPRGEPGVSGPPCILASESTLTGRFARPGAD
jgi:hypothetical protein